VQETYLHAWRSSDSFGGGSFRAWLYRIATNACLNALGGRKNVQRLLPDQQGPGDRPILAEGTGEILLTASASASAVTSAR
jgi:DNA-directed RNA polymerase specialized sigma24 family protein